MATRIHCRSRWSLPTVVTICSLSVAVQAQQTVIQPNITLSNIQHIFALGDSYTATGYAPERGLLNIPLIGGTSSGGLNWLQYLATSNPPSQNSFFSLAQFGANTNASVIPNDNSTTVPDFVQQTAIFRQFFVPPPPVVPWTSDNALFTIWFGINDIGGALVNNQSFPDSLSALSATYSTLVNELYQAGARQFLFLSVPSTDKSPLIVNFGEDAVEIVANNIRIFNDALKAYTDQFPSLFPDASYIYVDTVPIFDTILANPLQYGFADTTK
ncbi:hypothetical protein OIO90_002859 [Microbotryomycetes sp. JL221]|nr:hypothetical protein OIO90_002859 [Microbotryomycetes sp. JL221]